MHLINRLGVLLAVAGFFLSCSSQQPQYAYSEAAVAQSKANEAPVARKILYSATLELVVDEPDSTNKALEAIAKKHQGYASELGTTRSVIRVQSDHLKPALAEIATLGKVRSQRISGRDVTDEYYDYKIRLENAEKARQRYLELLKKAETVEATLQVEKELERLNGTIDQLKGRLQRLDHLEAFSTITITLQKRNKPGILGYVALGLYHSVKWLFVRN